MLLSILKRIDGTGVVYLWNGYAGELFDLGRMQLGKQIMFGDRDRRSYKCCCYVLYMSDWIAWRVSGLVSSFAEDFDPQREGN